MINHSDHRPDAAVHCAAILPFRPAPDRAAIRFGHMPQPVAHPDLVDLAKEPGLPDRLRDLLNG